MGVFNKTIIPLALVGYEMIIANSALHASLAIYHLIKGKLNHKISIYTMLTDFPDVHHVSFNFHLESNK